MVDGEVRVHVVVEHETMRELLVDLLVRERCIVASASPELHLELDLRVSSGDVLVIDEAAFAQRERRRRSSAAAVVAEEGYEAPDPLVVVVATEDDPSSRRAALAGGALGWIPRERLGDDLVPELHRVIDAVP